VAQTKRKRRSKHRGTAAGSIAARGRTGRKPTAEEIRQDARARREARLDRPPTWRSAITRAAFAAVLLFALFQFLGPDTTVANSGLLALLSMLIYVPLGYLVDRAVYNRRQRQKARASQAD
jgi:drug/metabolite transporter (DMT)-like permease